MKDFCICTLFSSSSGNATYIRHGGEEFLIDAGVSARSIETALRTLGTSLKNIKAIFITHEHNDHIKGLGTISKYFGIPIYAPILCNAEIKRLYPHSCDLLFTADDGCIAEFDNTTFCAFRSPHDSMASVSYRVDFGGKTLGYATDIGHVSERVLTALTGCDYVIIESNHDVAMLKNGVYPYYLKRRILGDYGHLSNASCANIVPFLVNKGTVSVLLAHLSHENNRPDIAYNESRVALEQKGMTAACEGKIGDVMLAVAARSAITVISNQ